jgi:hypothetical protein
MTRTMEGKAMGLVSIAIGATEILAPKQLEEVMDGIDLLMHDDPTIGLFGRVAGDLLDGVLLAVAGAKSRRMSGYAAVAGAVAPVVIADMVLAAKEAVS